MASSMCGEVISSRKVLLAILWSVVTLLSLGALVTAALLAVRIETRYYHLAANYQNNYDTDDYYQWYQEHCGDGQEEEGGRALEEGEDNNDSNEGGESGDRDEGDNDECQRHESWDEDTNPYDDADWPNSYYPALASASSFGVKFAALYTAALAVALSLYGSLAVVGFSSIRGQYIAPCFGGGSGVDSALRARIRVGAFMGCLVFFSNLCLVVAVLLGEFRIEDYVDSDQKQDVDSYAIERVSHVMAVLCGFLAVLYGTYALFVFAFKDDIISPGDEAEGLIGRGREESHMELSRIGRNNGPGGVGADGGAIGSDGTRGAYEPPLSPSGVGGVVGMSPGVVGKMQKDSDGFLTTHTTESY